MLGRCALHGVLLTVNTQGSKTGGGIPHHVWTQVCSLANFGNFQQACFLPVLATSYSTKCGNIWSTLGYYQMWLLPYSTKSGNIWSTLGYYHYFCTPPNVATFGVPLDITKCGYFRAPPKVATFGVPLDITKCQWLLLYSTKCGNIWTKCGYFRTPPKVATFGVPLDIALLQKSTFTRVYGLYTLPCLHSFLNKCTRSLQRLSI